jgi:DNA invertase Pin-like site-specific DNA recombinase
LKECEADDCPNLFVIKHASQRFCPPALGNKKSTCQNRAGQRKKRKKIEDTLKLHKQGKSNEDIAKIVGTKVAQVNKWIQKSKEE